MIAIPLAAALIVIVIVDLLPLLAPDRAHRQRSALSLYFGRVRECYHMADHRQPAPDRARAQARLPMAREPEAGPASKRSPGPAGTVPASPIAGTVPSGRHHRGEPRQPWDTCTDMPAVAACETEPLPEPELYTCEPHQIVAGFYRRYEQWHEGRWLP